MKKCLIITAAILASTIMGCVQREPESVTTAETIIENRADEEPTIENHAAEELYEQGDTEIRPSFINEIDFYSLEELFDSYIAAREGRESSDRSIAQITERINFASLNSIHLLTNPLPEFKIIHITVSENSVVYYYAPFTGEATIDKFNEVHNNKQYVLLSVSSFENNESQTSSSALDELMQYSYVGEKGMIDGKYHFIEASFGIGLYWEQDDKLFVVEMAKSETPHEDDEISNFIAGLTAHDLVKFMDTIEINMQDENNIAAWSAGDFSMFNEISR